MGGNVRFTGSFVAIITPFRRNKTIDSKQLEQLVDHHILSGTDGIVCCGCTGEGVGLSDAEKKRVADICIKTANQRIPIVVGTGTADTRQSVRLTESVQKLGAAGCLVVTPYYNKPSQKGCILHFETIARVGLPIVVYHNPARATVRLTPETMAQISKIPSVVALKESSHDLDFVKKVQALCSIPILAGDDDISFDLLREGGVGTISVIGNVIPRGWKTMVQYCLDKKWNAAERLAQFYMPLCKALFLETNPQCVKWVMQWLKMGGGVLRLPLIEPSESVQAKLKEELLRLSMPFLARKPIAV